jgi:NRPS condensation-like uncharacterized protein
MGRKAINTTIDEEIMRRIKFLALEKDCKINDLIEEGLLIILEKYENDKAKKED